jgi:hypothetical protein
MQGIMCRVLTNHLVPGGIEVYPCDIIHDFQHDFGIGGYFLRQGNLEEHLSKLEIVGS